MDDLIAKVQLEEKKDPAGYKHKEITKLLVRVYSLILEEIPNNPSHPKYYAGTAHDKAYRDWKKAKPGQQYRLFFKYSSEAKRIIYGWLNDTDTLRAYGSKSDAYRVFMKLLASQKIPNCTDELIKSSSPPRSPVWIP